MLGLPVALGLGVLVRVTVVEVPTVIEVVNVLTDDREGEELQLPKDG